MSILNHITPEEIEQIKKPAAAGLLVVTKNKEFLLTRRTKLANFLPGHWSVPSGESNVNELESLEDCARREFFEETKYLIPKDIRLLLVDRYFADERLYYLFICRVNNRFHVQLDFEHDMAAWFTSDRLPNPMAPQILDAISRV
jgi:ADP-ribose pyrophosphatase YjhB (NUDIX family)